MSIDDLRSQGLGPHDMSEGGFDETDIGEMDALEGSFVRGSGKALIRNGRIQLLEWKPFAYKHGEYDTLLPPRPQSACSTISDSPYLRKAARTGGARVKGSPYASYAARPASSNSFRGAALTMKNPKARQGAEAGWMDHVKMRQAADEWLSAQTKIRRKLQGLLPVPHGAKSSRVTSAHFHLNLAPALSQGNAPQSYSALGNAASLPLTAVQDEKDERARRLRLRNMWKGDLQASDVTWSIGVSVCRSDLLNLSRGRTDLPAPLQTELDGSISLLVLARVLGVPAPSKRHNKISPVLSAHRRHHPAAKMKQIQGGIFFPTSSNDDTHAALEGEGLTVGAEPHKESARKQPLLYSELADVAKVCAHATCTSARGAAHQGTLTTLLLKLNEFSPVPDPVLVLHLQALDLAASGRIDIRQFLDFVYAAPKRKVDSLLPPRPRSAINAR